MSVEIKLTVKFSFANGSAKPSMGEIAGFVKSLDADPAQMIATYRIADEKALFIKFKSDDAMRYCLMHNSDQLLFHYADGKVAEVRMSPAEDNIQYVRVYDLPPEVPDSDLGTVFGKYGEVKRVVREKFPLELGLDMLTGVRGVYMNVKMQIPNALHFQNRKGNIFYQGNRSLCFLCKTDGHLMNSCPKRKGQKQSQQQEQVDEQASTSTYAGVVESGSKNSEEMVEVLEEEIVETDAAAPAAVETNGEKSTEAPKQQERVFKYPNDAYYFYKFGIEDHTEKERIRDEEEAKRMALWKEEKLKEAMALKARKKAEGKLQSPPRKSKKSS